MLLYPVTFYYKYCQGFQLLGKVGEGYDSGPFLVTQLHLAIGMRDYKRQLTAKYKVI